MNSIAAQDGERFDNKQRTVGAIVHQYIDAGFAPGGTIVAVWTTTTKNRATAGKHIR
jgi:hypothetical protein